MDTPRQAAAGGWDVGSAIQEDPIKPLIVACSPRFRKSRLQQPMSSIRVLVRFIAVSTDSKDSCTIVNMEVVTDTNIFLAVALNEPEKEHIIQLTTAVSVIAPEILPYEIGNALSAMVKRRKLSKAEALAAEISAGDIPVRLVSVDIQAALQIAVAEDIYAYDAYFLQCARNYSLPLLTLDQRMKQVASNLGMQVLE
ncbi:MAG: type II toxin-antitoxin system VapC family toxin [Pseudohongiellaceae bacterium]